MSTALGEREVVYILLVEDDQDDFYLAQDVLRQNPAGGAVFAFRGRRGDRVKLLHFDGQGFCLYYKVLEHGRFPWPSAADGTARLTAAQLAMLWEGIDWRRPHWGAPPSRAG